MQTPTVHFSACPPLLPDNRQASGTTQQSYSLPLENPFRDLWPTNPIQTQNGDHFLQPQPDGVNDITAHTPYTGYESLLSTTQSYVSNPESTQKSPLQKNSQNPFIQKTTPHQQSLVISPVKSSEKLFVDNPQSVVLANQPAKQQLTSTNPFTTQTPNASLIPQKQPISSTSKKSSLITSGSTNTGTSTNTTSKHVTQPSKRLLDHPKEAINDTKIVAQKSELVNLIDQYTSSNPEQLTIHSNVSSLPTPLATVTVHEPLEKNSKKDSVSFDLVDKTLTTNKREKPSTFNETTNKLYSTAALDNCLTNSTEAQNIISELTITTAHEPIIDQKIIATPLKETTQSFIPQESELLYSDKTGNATPTIVSTVPRPVLPLPLIHKNNSITSTKKVGANSEESAPLQHQLLPVDQWP